VSQYQLQTGAEAIEGDLIMAKPGDRSDIEREIREIVNRVVRGSRAKDGKITFWYRLNEVTTIVASCVTSAGVSHPIFVFLASKSGEPALENALSAMQGFPAFFGGAGFLLLIAIAIGRKYYIANKVESKYAQAEALFENFKRIELRLRNHLLHPEPMQSLLNLRGEVFTLEENFMPVMPDYGLYSTKVDQYTRKLIEEYCDRWGSVPTQIAAG
jgi:hypothetical protein